MEGLRIFIIMCVVLLIGFLVYPIAMDIFSSFSTQVVQDDGNSPLVKMFFISFPFIMALGIVLFAMRGNR